MKRFFSIFLLFAFAVVPAMYGQLSVRATLNGANEGNLSPAVGTMFGKFSADYRSLTYQITYSKLQGTYTGSHFHFGPTTAILQAITFTGNTANGVWTFPDTLLKYFFNGGIYINIHSSAFPGGELRGNLEAAQVLFSVAMDSTFEGSNSPARGTGWFFLGDDSVPSLSYNITFTGLTGTYSGSHVHALPRGTIVFPLSTPDSASISGTWTTYADSLIPLLLRGQLYVNVHSTAHPGGEIRGMLKLSGEIPFTAPIDGPQAGTTSTARGTIWAALSQDVTNIRYAVTYAKLLGNYTNSHFHTSVGSGIIHPVPMTGHSTSGTWTGFSDANLEDLFRGRVYFNIHSSVNPGGEIRGLLHHYDGTFTTIIDGIQSGTGSPALGTAWIHFGGQSSSPSYQATFNDLTGTFTLAHFHIAPATSVVFPLTFPDSATTSGTWSPADSLVAALVRGNIYINIHSTVNPGGEIRGNFNVGTGVVTEVSEPPSNRPSAFRLEQNYPNPFNPATTIRYTLTGQSHVSLRVYDLLGRNVATLYEGEQHAGTFEATFDARALASGMYFYRLEANNNIAVKKMCLLR